MRFVCLMGLVVSTAAAAQAPVSAELVSDPFLESYQPEVSVSGNVIVGVMALSAVSAMLENKVAVRPTANADDNRVCLRVASRDGIYTSRNIYALPPAVKGPVLLPYQSKLKDVVEAYGTDEIALAATSGDCDSGSSRFYLLSGGENIEPSNVVIYLNSFGATDVFYELDGEINGCDYISEGRRTTYDYICRLGSTGAGESVPVTIIRERFGREQPSIDITIIGASE